MSKHNRMQSIDFFVAAEEHFAKIVENLQTQVKTENHLNIIEDDLLKETRELARLLLQGHIDSRGDGNAGVTVISTKNVKLQKRRKIQRSLKTLFGFVRINRVSYSSEGHQSL